MSPVRSAQLETPVLDPENPWPGLAPFDEQQAEFFFGRQREVEDLFRRVRLNLLTVLYGQSGLGKTSLVRAALFPRLRGAGMLPVAIRLDYSEEADAPRKQIWQATATALQQAGIAAPPLAEDQTLWEYFHLRSLERSAVPVLVFDQFEELFTLGTERSGGAGFVRDCLVELAALIENRPPDRVEARFDREPQLVAQYDFDRQDYRVLLSLREDYLAHLHDLAGQIPSITLNNMRLTPLDGLRALEAVEAPGRLRRLIAPGAAEAIVRVVAGARGERSATAHTGEHRVQQNARPLEELVIEPSLLSLLCRELNEKRKTEGLRAITPELVEANRENILHNFYTRCLAGLPEGVQVFVEEDLLTESGFRETVSVDSAAGRLRQRGADAAALKTLVDRRLLHYEQRGSVTRVELTHDVLAPVVRQSRTLRREREAIQEGEARKRRALEENERIAQQARAEAEAKYERSKRQRRLIAGFGIAMAAVAAVAVFALLQARANARQARASARQATESARKADSTAQVADSTARENARLLGISEAQNAKLEEQQKELRATAAAEARARAQADAAARTSAAMLGDFCVYSTDLVNTMGDSLGGGELYNLSPTVTNQRLMANYMTLLDQSELGVDRMIRRDSTNACPRRVDARLGTVGTQVRRWLDEQDRTKSGLAKVQAAREKGYHALEAVRAVARFDDSASRHVAARSYAELTYEFYLIAQVDHSVRDTLIRAAAEGARVAERADPASDRDTFDRVARLHHYGALSLNQNGRNEEAQRVVQSGFAAVRRGLARQDQDHEDLLFTQSQLWLRFGEADSGLKRARPAEQAFDSAIAVARTRLRRFQLARNRRWLALMQKSKGDLALGLNHPEEALSAYDSSAVNYGLYQVRMRESDGDTVSAAQGLQQLSLVRMQQQRALLQLGRTSQAMAAARASVDSAAVADRLGSAVGETPMLETRYSTAVANLDRYLPRERADSLKSEWFSRDSTSYAQLPAGSGLKRQRGHALDLLLGELHAASTRRFRSDSAGKPRAEAARLRAHHEGTTVRYRQAMVWLRRDQAARSGTAAARDSLGTALGNLSWTYLLLGRAAEAAAAAAEGIEAAPGQDYIIPNLVNALLLRGPEPEAQAAFARYAGTQVETPKVRFECATGRDLALLVEVGVAGQPHLDAFHRFLAGRTVPCPRNAQIP